MDSLGNARRFETVVERDVEFARPGGVPLHADLSLPVGPDAPSPAILWLHAGGWRNGSRRLAPDLTQFFAQRGFAMVAVQYRLTHQATFPAQLEDVKTAVRWLRSQAGRYRVDPGRIGLWGSSAGGHLASLAALSAPGTFEPAGSPDATHRSDVQAVAAGYPPIDFLELDADRPPPGTPCSDPETLRLPRPDMQAAHPDSFESLLVGGPIHTRLDVVRAASPLTYVAPGAPPFLILHGREDTTIGWRQSERLYRALASQDGDVTLCLIDGLGHGFLRRTHLDENGGRRMTVRRHAPGAGETREERRSPVFPIIEDFFRTHLRQRE